MGKYLALIGGLAAMAAGLILVVIWWKPFVQLLQGCLPPFLIVGGFVALIAGISSIKDAQRTKKLEEETKEEERAEEKK